MPANFWAGFDCFVAVLETGSISVTFISAVGGLCFYFQKKVFSD